MTAILQSLLLVLSLLLASHAWASSYRDSTTNNGTSAAPTATVPTGTTNGDVVIVFVQLNSGTATCADNNGATPFTEDVSEYRPVSPSMTTCVYSRRITGGEPSPYAFTSSASVDWRATAVTISNPHSSIIYDAGPSTNSGTSSPIVATGITTSSDNALMIVWYGVDDPAATFSSPPGAYTERENSGGSDRPHWLGTRNKTPAGAESDQSISRTGGSIQASAIMIAIEEPVASTRPKPSLLWLGWLIELFSPQEAYAQ